MYSTERKNFLCGKNKTEALMRTNEKFRRHNLLVLSTKEGVVV